MLRTALPAVALALAASAAATATPAQASTPSPSWAGAAQSGYTAQVFDLLNAERRAVGLAPLRRSWCATAYAGGQSTRMAVRRTMFHQAISPVVRVCRAQWAGENVAWGTWGPERVVAGWMASPSHRANVLNPRYTHLGVGASRSTGGPVYAATVFLDLSH